MRMLLIFLSCVALGLPGVTRASALSPHGATVPEGVGTQQAKADKPSKADKPKKGKGAASAEPTPEPPPPDADGDGVSDSGDRCPSEAEDKDGFEDGDGCPDPDNDGDGVVDPSDSCPGEKENVDGWDDGDGCPETAPAIPAFLIDATLMDGTTLQGKVIRIVAHDEDEPQSKPSEPTGLGVIVDESAEFETPWANIATLTSEKVSFTEAVDCYSEGVEKLGDEPIWECTLKHPTTLKLLKSEHKGAHLVLDRQMRRLDFKIEGLTCAGPSCEAITLARGVSWYLYKLMGFKASEEESAAVMELQKTLRAVQQQQVKKATFKPVPS